jgi:hypothetical protein
MAHDVHLHVCFPCDANEDVAELARKYLELWGIRPTSDDSRWPMRPAPNAPWADSWEAGCFLVDLSLRTGPNLGRKGGLCLWGIVGDYTDTEKFMEVLRPFWMDLLNLDGELLGGPLSFEHILVFYEEEGSEQAHAYEVMDAADGTGDRVEQLVIKHHDLPFCWQQH